ncbi:ABC transporter substrate-binding protein [Pseudonocardia sp. NPDC049154]|uniref:ABC transporter substrate-binding protein n=1 Tax=Pseudonocardia sp. NPDC049154 TaxID=3155501 RepID=UPI0033E83419
MHRSTRTKWWGALAAATALTLLTACGGGAASSGGGDPIKVMLISQLESADFSWPEIESMSRAAIKPVNDAGGIGSRQIELEVCNEQRDANKAAACARQAVSDEVDLVLAPFTNFGGSILPILEQARIAYTGNTVLAPDDGTNPVSFPLLGGTPSGGAGVGTEFVRRGCTQAGAIGYDNASSNAFIGYVERGLKSAGGSLVAQARVAPGTPDYAPALATVTAGGAKCIFLALPPNEAAKLISAVAQSPTKPLLGASYATIPPAVISKVPAEAVEGTVLIGQSFAYNDEVDQMRVMSQQASAAGVPEEQIRGSYGVLSWSVATIALEALKSIPGEIDQKSVFDAMAKIEQPATGPLGAFTTSREFAAPGLNRLFNRNVLTYTVKGGQTVLDSPEWHDMSSALSGTTS